MRFLQALFARAADPVANIFELVRRHNDRLLSKEDKAVRRIRGAWRVAERGIERRLEALVAKIAAATADGEPVNKSWLYQEERYQTLLAEIKGQVDRFSAKAAGITLDQQAVSLAQGLKDSMVLMRATGVSASFVMLPYSAVESMVGMLQDGSPLRDHFAKYGRSAVTQARAIFAEGIAAGDHPYTMARKLRAAIPAMTEESAVLTARTESIRAYTIGTRRNYAANSRVVIAGRIVSARDKRTCYLCIARDGTIIEHSEGMSRHPGCRCTVVPVVRHVDVFRGTGEEWLRAQPEAVQLKKLGPGRYRLFSTGQVSMQDMIREPNESRWGKQIKPVRIDELRRRVAAGEPPAKQKTWVPGMDLAHKRD